MNATPTQSSLISIAEAARLFGVHRRTIERWIQAGQVSTSVSEGDRRKRLVELAEIQAKTEAMRKAMAEKSAVRQLADAPVVERQSVSPQESDEQRQVQSSSFDDLSDHHREIIDNALQLVYSHHHRLVSQLVPEAFRPLTLDQLRNGPLGHDLLRLAQIAQGQFQIPKEQVLDAIDSVLQLFFWPAAAEDYSVPRAFWDTDFGRMLALAKYRAYEAKELVTINEAAQILGVTRPTIYHWMDDRTLSYVREDMSGRTFVVRRDIDKLKRIARMFSVREAKRQPDEGEDNEG